MKRFRLYITEEDIKNKFGKEYMNSNVIFTNTIIGLDNTVTFEGILVNEDVPSLDIRREKF